MEKERLAVMLTLGKTTFGLGVRHTGQASQSRPVEITGYIFIRGRGIPCAFVACKHDDQRKEQAYTEAEQS